MTDIIDGDGFRLHHYDPATGRSVWVKWQDGLPLYRFDMPVDDILAANAEARAASSGQRHGEWARIASIPLPLFYASELNRAFEEGDRKHIQKVLNDSEWRAWRTKESKV